MAKTRMAWLPDGEKNSDIFIHFGATNERDRQTDRHRMPAIAALMHSIAEQKLEWCGYPIVKKYDMLAVSTEYRHVTDGQTDA